MNVHMNLKRFYMGRAIGFVAIIVILIGVLAIWKLLPAPAPVSPSEHVPDASLVITQSEIPKGWTILQKNDSSLVLERADVWAPGIGTTTQRIRIYAYATALLPEEWIGKQIDLNDHSQIYDYLWDDLNGVKHLRVTHKTISDDAQDDYYFGNGRVILSIFQPLQSLQNLQDLKTRQDYQQFLNEVVEPRVDPDAGKWQTYTNTAYGYTLMYPRNATASQIAEYEPEDMARVASATIFSPGGAVTRMDIEAYLPYDEGMYIDQAVKERNSLVALSLEQFAAHIRQDQIDDTNLNMKDRQIGALTETTFAGHTAYAFTLTDGFTREVSGSGYTLPQGATFNFVSVKNNAGVKLLISYPLNDDNAAKMAESFNFIDPQ